MKEIEKIKVDNYAESDIKQILLGTFSPINGFMNLNEIGSVLNKNKLIDGSIWTLPIVLPIKEDQNLRVLINKIYKIINNKNKRTLLH